MIHLERVSRVYRDGERKIHALAEVDLYVPRGATVALLGKSGSGKSTLLHLMGGLEWPSEGRVTIAGQALNALSDQALTDFRLRHIGFVFQFYHLLPALTVMENLLLPAELASYGAHQAKAKALALLADVELQGRSDTFPDRLSGGEQQRIAVARALMLDPPVLLADEPTGNLDSETGQRVLELLWRLTTARATTLVIATHSPEVAERAARRIELRDGGVLSDSAPHSPPTPAASAAAPPRSFKGRHP